MLTILTGPARSGKTRRIAAMISQSEKKDLVLLTPEQASHEAERALAAACGPTVNLKAEVLSFTRLASRVFTELGGAADVLPDRGTRLLLMSLALSSAASRLQLYGSRRRTDYIESLLAAREELHRAAVTPARLGELAAGTEGELGKKLSDLALLCETYDTLLAQRLADSRERLDRLAELITGSRVGLGGIFFDGFTDFTPQELNVFDSLLRRGGDLCVSLCTDGSESPHFAVANATLRRLRAMAERRAVPVRVENLAYRDPARDPALALYCENLFNYKSFPPPEEPCASLEAAQADGLFAECEIAAGRVLRWMKEDPTLRWADIAVASRRFGDYESLAESVFALYGIPVFVDRAEDLARKGLFALLRSALETATGGWRQEDVLRCLKTGLAGLEPDEVSLLENYCFTWGIRGEAAWRREWIMNPRGYAGEDTEKDREQLRQINALRQRAAEPLHRLSEALQAAETALDFARGVWACLEALNLAETLPRRAAALRDAGRGPEAEELLRAWDLLCEALDQFAATLGDMPLPSEEAARLFLLLLSRASAGRIPTALDAVSLGELTRLRGRRVRRLVILGASEENLPLLAENGGIFSQWERQQLTELGLALEQVPDEALCREFSALYLALSAASERLCLLWPAGSTSSFLVKRAGAILGVEPLPGVRLRQEAAMEAEEPLFRLALSPTGGAEAAAARALAQELWPERWQQARQAADPERGSLSPAVAETLYGRHIELTASKAEKFSVCRFAYFLRYGLGAQPRPRSAIDAPEFGTFVHYVLEHTARAAKAEGGFAALGEEGCLAAAEQAVERYIAEDLRGFAGKSPRFIYLFRRLRSQVLAIVSDVAEELAVSDFEPLDFELDFSRSGDLPPVRVDCGDFDLSVRGKVDRVDGWVHGGKLYLRVEDYKTGKTKFDLSNVWYGKGIQMLIYLFALQAEGEARYGLPVVPAGVLYTPTKDPALPLSRSSTEEKIAAERRKLLQRSGLLLDDPAVIEAMEKSDSPVYIPVSFKNGEAVGSLASLERLGRLAGHVRGTLQAMGRELRAGSIEANPLKNSAEDPCVYCDYVTACDFREGKDRARIKRRISAEDFWAEMEKTAE